MHVRTLQNEVKQEFGLFAIYSIYRARAEMLTSPPVNYLNILNHIFIRYSNADSAYIISVGYY